MNDLVDQNMPSAKAFQNLKDDYHLLPSLMIMAKAKKDQLPDWTEIDQWLIQIRQAEENGINRIFTPWDVLKTHISEGHFIYKKQLPDFSLTKGLFPISDTPWSNILTSSDATDAGIIIDFEAPPENSKFGSFEPESVAKVIESLSNFNFKTLETYVAGPAAFTFYAIKGVSYNMKLNFAFLGVLFFLMRFLFGTFSSGFLLLFTFLWTGIVVHGLMAATGFAMEILSSGLFAMIVVSSLEDFLFICHEQKKGHSLETTFSRLFWPSLITSLTTVLGFGSLMLTDIDIISRFGLWASIGALLEWFSTFFLLPSLMKVFKITHLSKVKSSSSIFQNIDQKINRFSPKKIVSLSFLGTYFFAAYFLFQFNVSDNPLSLFPKNHKIVSDFNYLNLSRGWQTDGSLVFEVEVSEEKQLNIIEKIKKLPNIAKIESIFEVENYFIGPDPYQYAKAIKQNLEQHALSDRYRGKLLSYRHIIYFKDSEFLAMKKSINDINQLCHGDCQLIGEVVSYTEFMDKVPLGLIKSLGGSLLLVAFVLLIIAYIFKHQSPILFVLGSLWGSSVLIILMWLANLQINFLSCVFICMMVGLTGDNGVQFLFAEKREGHGKGINYHQACALEVGLIMALSCLFFLFSYFAPPREFGPLMCLGFLFSVFGDIWITKSLTQTKELW
ncbi:MAG: hypothetical protein Fur0010_14370 [Bdellovibrio sp.]